MFLCWQARMASLSHQMFELWKVVRMLQYSSPAASAQPARSYIPLDPEDAQMEELSPHMAASRPEEASERKLPPDPALPTADFDATAEDPADLPAAYEPAFTAAAAQAGINGPMLPLPLPHAADEPMEHPVNGYEEFSGGDNLGEAVGDDVRDPLGYMDPLDESPPQPRIEDTLLSHFLHEKACCMLASGLSDCPAWSGCAWIQQPAVCHALYAMHDPQPA